MRTAARVQGVLAIRFVRAQIVGVGLDKRAAKSLRTGQTGKGGYPEPKVVFPAAGATCRPVQKDEDLARYYGERAPELEESYTIPERQDDLQGLRERLARSVSGEDVLELACGTGYWTEVMATTARSVLATDISPEMLALARRKAYGPARVTLCQADAWHLETVPGQYSVGAALFWWSHMPNSRLGLFLDQLHRLLLPGALVILADNLPSDCRHSAVVGTDGEGNSYQRRLLRTGSEFEIIKNYPDEEDLRAALAGRAEAIEYTPFTCLWLLTYRCLFPRPAPPGPPEGF